jgi:hypothetical protein
MNSDNLIRLGVFAAHAYQMQDDFKIMRVPSDARSIIAIRVPDCGTLFHVSPQPITEIVITQLDEFWFNNNLETVRMAYSPEANALVIQETEGA